MPAEDALSVLNSLMNLINVLDTSMYSLYEEESKQRIAVRDINDWLIVATALLLDCPIWTEDNDFFGSGIATWTSDRVNLYLS